MRLKDGSGACCFQIDTYEVFTYTYFSKITVLIYCFVTDFATLL